jgi:hypothetical protein
MSYLRYLCLFVGWLMSYLRYLCLFVGWPMSYLRYLCLFATGGKDEPNIIIRHEHSYKQLEVKTNQTNTNNVNKT